MTGGAARAIVVGGGIGGLAAGAALSRTGWDVTVFERAAALEDVGAGIGMAPNALRALDVLGVGDAIRAGAAQSLTGGVRRPDGTWLAYSSLAAFRRRFHDAIAVPSRSELVGLLAGLLPAGVLRLGQEAAVVDPGTADRPAVVTVAGNREPADLVVAADGLRSPARTAHLAGDPGVHYTGWTSWRFVVPGVEPAEYGETWGPGRTFGLNPMAGGRVYGYAAARRPAGERPSGPRGDADLLAELYAGWHDPVPALLAGLAPDAALRRDIWELARPLRAFHAGRLALVGDAAHAMAPNLGQGGGTALEDAVVLAATVAAAARRTGTGCPVHDLLPAYSAARVARAAAIWRASRRMAALGALGGPAARVRDLLLVPARLLSDDLAVSLFFGLVDWRPPPLPRAEPVD